MVYCRCNPDGEDSEEDLNDLFAWAQKEGEKDYIKRVGGLCVYCDGLLQYCQVCDLIYCDCSPCKCRRNPDSPGKKAFEEKVRHLRESGMSDRYIVRQIVDDHYRKTGKALPQHVVERLVQQVL